MDQGIIAAFKARYKAKLLAWKLQMFRDDPTRDMRKVMPNVKQALVWMVDSWAAMQDSTFKNCWRKAAIVPQAWLMQPSAEAQPAADGEGEGAGDGDTDSDGAADAADAPAARDPEADLLDDSMEEELGRLIEQLPGDAGEKMTAAEYIDLPDEHVTEGRRTVAEIVQLVVGGGEGAGEDGTPGSAAGTSADQADPDDVAPRAVSLAEAQQAAAALSLFVGDQGNLFTDEEKSVLARMMARVQRMDVANLGRLL